MTRLHDPRRDRLTPDEVLWLTMAVLSLPAARLEADRTKEGRRGNLLRSFSLHLGVTVPQVAIGPFGYDPGGALQDLDEGNKMLRALKCHAMIHATLVPSKAVAGGRAFALRPGFVVTLDDDAVSVLVAAAQKRLWLGNKNVIDVLDRQANASGYLKHALSRWQVHRVPGLAEHWHHAAAWLRASATRPAETTARLLEAHAR